MAAEKAGWVSLLPWAREKTILTPPAQILERRAGRDHQRRSDESPRRLAVCAEQGRATAALGSGGKEG